MSLTGLRFLPPDQSDAGFKIRIASVLCIIFGFFSLLFFAKHIIVFQGVGIPRLLPGSPHVGWDYLVAYYSNTLHGAAEFVVILGVFASVFWLNVAKLYFAGQYRDYNKEKTSPEANSLTLFLTLTALTLVLLSVPFLTLHFPVWVSYLAKFGPLAAGVLQYLSILPDLSHIERLAAIDKLGWDRQCYDAKYRFPPGKALQNEIDRCLRLMPRSCPDQARRFFAQGSVTVAWSGVNALFNNLETFLGVGAEYMSRHPNATAAIEVALGEILDARNLQPTVVLTTDAEHASLREMIGGLQGMYPVRLETVAIQEALWRNASRNEIVALIAKRCLESKADIAILSHVFPDTGVVLDLKPLIEAVRKEGLNTLFAIDGSQAVGNIAVEDDVLSRSAYYAFHGHGWLLVSPSAGVLIRNGWLLSAAGLPPKPEEFRQSDLPSGSESIPWFALNYVLKREWLAVGVGSAVGHSAKLASLFRDEMRKRDIRTLSSSGMSSVVVITGLAGIAALVETLKAKRVQCSLASHGIRFCFHHYHRDDDVRDLAEFIGDVAVQASDPPPGQPGVIAFPQATRGSDADPPSTRAASAASG